MPKAEHRLKQEDIYPEGTAEPQQQPQQFIPGGMDPQSNFEIN